ncbi:TPT-domain-containing protein [Mycena floridula]|nr:TPT-domain-containing protein [Mycena floridula]
MLSSNSTQLAAASLIITAKPLFLQPNTHSKENERPGDRHRPRVISQSLRLSSLHKRAYHHEPYPAFTDASPTSAVTPEDSSLPPCILSPLFSPSGKPPVWLWQPQYLWLLLYFFFNLTLTLYNKLVLVRFPFPYTLTALHTLLGTTGCFFLVQTGVITPVELTLQEIIVLFAFSILYTVNIVVSNLSLQLVTVAFHQVVRASTPIFTIVFCRIMFGADSSRAKLISLTPVVVGVGFATYGDYYFTPWGFFLTFLGTVLAALKTILTNVMQSPLPLSTSKTSSHSSIGSRIQSFLRLIPFPRLHPLGLLCFLSPLAFVECMILAYWSGETEHVRRYAAREMTLFTVVALFLNGLLAFGLNIVSFSANKRVGALTMTVAANVKQALTILCGVLIFNLNITVTNGLGILLTIAGGAWYGYVELVEKEYNKIH